MCEWTEELAQGRKAETARVTSWWGTMAVVTVLSFLLHPNESTWYGRCGLTFRGASNALIRYVLLMAALQ